MATLTVRSLREDLKARLRVRAARNGRSMEAEARAILRSALTDGDEAPGGLGTRIHERFAGLDAEPIEAPARTEPARAADFGA